MVRGFKNRNLNTKVVEKMLKNIIRSLLCASKQLVIDYQNELIKIENNENKIRDEIYRHYLKNKNFIEKNKIQFNFEKEVEENFQGKGQPTLGRVDLKVFNGDIFNDPDAYVIIECKRLDGKKHLNREYVNNGILRFIDDNPKYSSHYNCNIMFGFLVKENIEQDNLVHEINKIQKEIDSFNIQQEIKKEDNTYHSIYETKKFKKKLELYHVFYDFSSIII